jgi:putative transposase
MKTCIQSIGVYHFHMSRSLVFNYQHIVFSTKLREPIIPKAMQPRLWRYMAGIAKNINAIPMAIGGMEDHVHLLIALPADLSVAKTVNILKSNSSKWMSHGFRWQSHYASFSVSASNLARTTEYIENQEAHHRKRDFRAEMVVLLEKHGIRASNADVFE